MLKLSLPKYLLLALFFWISAAGTPAQELEITGTVEEEPQIPALPPPVPLSPAESNFVEADEFAPASSQPPAATAMAAEDPETPPAPPVPAPPPLPETTVDPPVVPPQAFFTSAPSLEDVQRVTPLVEVWRNQSNGSIGSDPPPPQTPRRYGGGLHHHQRLEPAVFTGDESVTVRLQFDSSASGKQVMVKAGAGLSVDPAEELLLVDSRGECILTAALKPGLSGSRLTFVCDGVTTILPLARTSAEVVDAIEGGRQGEAQP